MIFHVGTFYRKQVRILNMIELQAIIICYILEIINQLVRRKDTVQESTVV